jgi:NNP family nitrate/nitrite transporter-like MFS transporter
MSFLYVGTFGSFLGLSAAFPAVLAYAFPADQKFRLFALLLPVAFLGPLVGSLARPLGGWIADRVGAVPVLLVSFAGSAILAAALTGFYTQIVPLTAACLGLAAAFGLGTGAVFKMVGEEFPGSVGAVTGVVGAAGGLGGFFPPIVMAAVRTGTGSYTLGFLLLSATAVVCLAVLVMMGLPGARRPTLAPPVGGR